MLRRRQAAGEKHGAVGLLRMTAAAAVIAAGCLCLPARASAPSVKVLTDRASAAAAAAGRTCARMGEAYATPEMRVTAIDFGQAEYPGDVILVSSGGRHLLMDTGLPDNVEDPDGCMTIRWLKDSGISDLDLYLSHYHDDHYFLMCTILEDAFFHVGRIYLPDVETLLTYSDPTYMWETWYGSLTKNLSLSGSWGENARSAILADAEELGVPVTTLTQGDSFPLGFSNVEILWQETDPVPEGDNATDAINRTSLVAMVTGGGCRYLTGGDMYVSNELHMLEAGVDVQADIFKLSHHGGETSNDPAFLQATGARYAILEDYPHRQLASPKSEKAVAAAQEAGMTVMSPRRHGTFTYVCRGGEITVLGGERNREEWEGR